MNRLAVVAAIPIALLGTALPQDAVACSYNRAAFKAPSVSEIMSSHPIVFVGVVTQVEERQSVGREKKPPLRYATFEIEIPIKGTEGKRTIEIETRGGGDCFYGFSIGERWFLAGGSDGASYFSGSIVLADTEGSRPPDSDLSDHEKALRKAFPAILKLPLPARPAKPAP